MIFNRITDEDFQNKIACDEIRQHPVSKYWVNADGTLIINPYSKRILKITLASTGYLRVGNYIGTTSGGVHRIVYETWVGEIPSPLQINHIDGVKTNNHFSNLEAVTGSENVIHAHFTGLSSGGIGEDNAMAKVVEEDVLEMYKLFKMGKNNDEVGSIFGLHPRYVSLIRHGKRWSHLYHEVMPLSLTSIYSTETILEAFRLIEVEKLANIEVVRRTGMEASMVSRMRTRKVWKDFYEKVFLPTL